MIASSSKWDVALVMPRWLYYSAELADGAASYVDEHPHFRLCELPMEDYGDHRRLDQADIDSVLVWADAHDRWVVNLWTEGMPVVSCGSDLMETGVPMVATASCTRQAVAFLAELDRPSLAFVCPDPDTHPAWRRKREEFFMLARSTGIEPLFCPLLGPDPSDSPEVLVEDPDHPEMRAFLESIPKPAAIWCAYDSIGVQVCRVARRAGFKIPEDVAVLGAGNSRMGRFANPPLSTFAFPSVRVGYLAMALIHRMLRGESIPQEEIQTFVPVPPVIPRESTGHGEHLDESIHHAYRLIARHAHEGITVNEIVNAVHLSRQTFHKRFVEAFDCTPAQKIRSFRLEKAKELLASTDLAVTRIADFCGFSEQSKFYNFFKREAHCSPSEWRKKCRNPRDSHP